MKILIFTDKDDYFNVIQQLLMDINKHIVLERVSQFELSNMVLSNPEHVVLIDDRLYHSLNDDFFEVLKKNSNELIVFLQGKSNVQRYLNFNMVDYFMKLLKLQKKSYRIQVEICMPVLPEIAH